MDQNKWSSQHLQKTYLDNALRLQKWAFKGLFQGQYSNKEFIMQLNWLLKVALPVVEDKNVFS